MTFPTNEQLERVHEELDLVVALPVSEARENRLDYATWLLARIVKNAKGNPVGTDLATDLREARDALNEWGVA